MHTNILASALSLALVGSAHAQTSLGGVSFLDRAARGEITIGTARGSLGVIDYDNDGWYDLFMADSAGLPNRLFHNVPDASRPGGRRFDDATAASGIGDADGTARGFGSVVVFDFNNDGYSDIYTVGNAPDGTSGVLYQNNGGLAGGMGTFANITIAAGLRQSGITQDSASAVDFDHDGDLDLLLCNYSSPGQALVLMLNNGDSTFLTRPDLLPAVGFTGRIYAHGWTDYDHDGWEDGLVLLNNGVPLTLRNVANPSGGRRFADATASSGFTSIGPAPMGFNLGDWDLDGDLDIAITDASTGTYYENRGGLLVRVFPFATFFGWGTTFLDANNDLWPDHYQAGSYSASAVDHLWRNDTFGVWTNVQAALNTTALPSQHCVRVDFDNDGREDIITNNPGRFVSIHHNQSPSGHHWVKFKLVGAQGVNRDACGALVRITAGGKTQTHELGIGTSFGSTEDLRAHFGTRIFPTIDNIEIVWPRPGSIVSRSDFFCGPFATDRIYTLHPRPICPGDYNIDNVLSVQDIFDYLAAWFDGQPQAEMNEQGGLNVQDIFDFLAAWFAGC